MELLNATLAKIYGLDKEAMVKAQAHQDILIKPQGSLGKLEAIVVQLAGIQGDAKPKTA
ncbi:nicotinate-nucleotide--dimethylbenzimidazole phosphoribosyltransferase, partial [Dehalococcoides mccartyi]